jgi:hypothetical protein
MFSVSTCFGHYLPILRRHCTNAELVTIVCSCRCGLVWGYGKSSHILRPTHARNMPRHWTSIKCSESEVYIKLVVLLRNYVTIGQQNIKFYTSTKLRTQLLQCSGLTLVWVSAYQPGWCLGNALGLWSVGARFASQSWHRSWLKLRGFSTQTAGQLLHKTAIAAVHILSTTSFSNHANYCSMM